RTGTPHPGCIWSHPDLIILDVMLPDINGKDVCLRVRNDKSLEAVKIICVSGMVEEDKIEELHRAGANEFLAKPFETERLIERICALLEIETFA
ncbi:MAG: response regulator transcription factor, partial [Thermoguttaceae bacterium]|nr:response regulator transcription factor [Thermoguttaceae bacterium]